MKIFILDNMWNSVIERQKLMRRKEKAEMKTYTRSIKNLERRVGLREYHMPTAIILAIALPLEKDENIGMCI